MMSYKHLPWDSEFFGPKIGHLAPCESAEEFSRAVAEAKREGFKCLYYLCSSNDVDRIRWAEEAGGRLVDIRVTLENNLSREPRLVRQKKHTIRRATIADEDALKAI